MTYFLKSDEEQLRMFVGSLTGKEARAALTRIRWDSDMKRLPMAGKALNTKNVFSFAPSAWSDGQGVHAAPQPC